GESLFHGSGECLRAGYKGKPRIVAEGAAGRNSHSQPQAELTHMESPAAPGRKTESIAVTFARCYSTTTRGAGLAYHSLSTSSACLPYTQKPRWACASSSGYNRAGQSHQA